MMKKNISRRGVLAGLLSTIASALTAGKVNAAIRTPEATEGPFYPEESMRFDDADNDLVKIDSKVNEAGGDILHLDGVITDSTGQAMSGLRIEIWQCDVNGKYLHPGDNRNVAYDSGFQGFGHDITDDEGRYRFRTIVPTEYPGRTPHIHVKILRDGEEIITSQLYIKDNPDNDADRIFRRLSKDQADAVSMNIISGSNGLETTVDLVV